MQKSLCENCKCCTFSHDGFIIRLRFGRLRFTSTCIWHKYKHMTAILKESTPDKIIKNDNMIVPLQKGHVVKSHRHFYLVLTVYPC